MKATLVRICAVLVLSVGLVAVPAPAQAAPPPVWQITEVVMQAYTGPTGYATFQPACPAGQVPISGGYTAADADVRRVAEKFEYSSGGRYIVDLFGPVGSQITARVLCVPSTYFSGVHQVVGAFTVGADHIAAGTVSCPSGEKALHASVTFGGVESTVLTTYPNAGLGSWYVKGWNQAIGSSMVVWVQCASGAGFEWMRTVNTATAIGWGTTTLAACGTGMRPIAGGTYHSGGDGGAITVQSRPVATTGSSGSASWPEGRWQSISLSTSGGYMITNVMCVPSTEPVIRLVSAGPTPAPDSTTARWAFTAVDPPGGYGMVVYCYFSAPGQPPVLHQPCASPFDAPGLADGSYNLTVHADTVDGRWQSLGLSSVIIDTTVPVVGLQNALFATSSPSLGLSVFDATMVEQLSCSLDGTAIDPCGDGYHPGECDPEFGCFPDYYDYRYSQVLPLSGLAHGPHVLHVEAVDERGNSTTGDLPFVVDTVKPTVTQTAPASPFTVGTSIVVKWKGQDSGSGVESYDIRWQKAAHTADAFGVWTTVTSPKTATSRTISPVTRGATYCSTVRASDRAGNLSTVTPARCTAIPLDDRDLADSSGWTRSSPSGWFRGTALTSTRLGATLAVTGVTLKRVAVVAKKCPTCGIVGVYVSGQLVGKVDLRASTTSRQVVALPAFSLRTGTVKLKVLTSGKPVKIDALGVSRR